MWKLTLNGGEERNYQRPQHVKCGAIVLVMVVGHELYWIMSLLVMKHGKHIRIFIGATMTLPRFAERFEVWIPDSKELKIRRFANAATLSPTPDVSGRLGGTASLNYSEMWWQNMTKLWIEESKICIDPLCKNIPQLTHWKVSWKAGSLKFTEIQRQVSSRVSTPQVRRCACKKTVLVLSVSMIADGYCIK